MVDGEPERKDAILKEMVLSEILTYVASFEAIEHMADRESGSCLEPRGFVGR